MGAVSLKTGNGTVRFRSRPSLCSSSALIIFSAIATNIFTLLAFTYYYSPNAVTADRNHISVVSEQLSVILSEIDSSRKKLAQMERDLLGYTSFDLSRSNVSSGELKAFLLPHPLPLGRDSRTGITEMLASVGHSCRKSADLLSRFMSYKVNGHCPDDWNLGQNLILKGCEPLPRRRCLSKITPKPGLLPFPASLWAWNKNATSEKILTWTGISCKNLSCLNSKKLNRDCGGCFDLSKGYETQKYVKPKGKNDFSIDEVLAMGGGGIRVGFDIGGGSGTFAARMAERGLTVVTATLNVDAPFNDFIASRGLFPLYSSLDQRFPFHDNVFDLIRAGSGLDVGGRPEKLEFLMFDVDRILRAGGLVWLDNFFCSSDGKKNGVTRLVERFGYKKLKWVVGEKINGSGKSEVYLSAILKKPVRVD
ncbi:hypothetical protein DM860_013337 [Cuscuta australis]|uniref:Methyltransferase type 11 domain-containing protein n=1 Tax=Cuscuta australis TaxID=267555 RepID=A0A328DNW9_9ASTE|nr:hypothetical protein DM860_013337 [Cuscuta australis]